MKASPNRIVGLFAEGSRQTDPFVDNFGEIWRLISAHCGHPVEIKVFPFDKGHIVRLSPERIPIRATATKLMRVKGPAPGEPLDVLLARQISGERLDRIVVAFDRFPSNQYLTDAERLRSCPMRAEVAFVLERLSRSSQMPERFKVSARRLLERYTSDDVLLPRCRASEAIEVVFMDPMFEAILVSDEATIRNALGFKSRPKDWPTFKTYERALDKRVLDPAVQCYFGRPGAYIEKKAYWGHKFIAAAGQTAALWKHPIARRICRTLAA
jgi:hypothetical protein